MAFLPSAVSGCLHSLLDARSQCRQRDQQRFLEQTRAALRTAVLGKGPPGKPGAV